MKLAVLPLTTVAALGAGPGSASVTQTKQTCEDAPCANGGTCIPSDNVSPPKFYFNFLLIIKILNMSFYFLILTFCQKMVRF